jgi:Cu(I)/Ag(I) efflux system membrane fusion protein
VQRRHGHQDGKREVLFVPRPRDARESPGLQCFDADSKLRWTYRYDGEIRFGDETFRRMPVKGYDLNSKAFAITEGIEPGWKVLIEGAVLLNDRFAKQED